MPWVGHAPRSWSWTKPRPTDLSRKPRLLIATLMFLPIILLYTGGSYWVFRGARSAVKLVTTDGRPGAIKPAVAARRQEGDGHGRPLAQRGRAEHGAEVLVSA